MTSKPTDFQFVFQLQSSYLDLVVSRQRFSGKISFLVCTVNLKVNMANMWLTKHISVAMGLSSQLIIVFRKKIFTLASSYYKYITWEKIQPTVQLNTTQLKHTTDWRSMCLKTMNVRGIALSYLPPKGLNKFRGVLMNLSNMSVENFASKVNSKSWNWFKLITPWWCFLLYLSLQIWVTGYSLWVGSLKHWKKIFQQ